MAKRGRPPGAKNKPKNGASSDPGGGTGTAPVGHNQLSDSDLEALTRQFANERAELLSLEKAAKANRMNLDKKIKAQLGDDGLKDIKQLEMMSTPEGEEKIRAEVDRMARVARWEGMQIGTQGTLFEEDRRPVEERAFADGRRDGLAGKSLVNPHAPGAPAWEPYNNGWRQGQSELFAIKKPVIPTADIIKTDKSEEPSEVDEFDMDGDTPPHHAAEEERKSFQ